MMSMEKQQQRPNSCQLCGSHEVSKSKVMYHNRRRETVPVCGACGHYMYADTTYKYSYTVRGIARDWASAGDLRGVIEDVLKANMPAEDVKGLEINVMVEAGRAE